LDRDRSQHCELVEPTVSAKPKLAKARDVETRIVTVRTTAQHDGAARRRIRYKV
jgi:hypothetical protein